MANTLASTLIATLAPSAIDATWTNFSNVTGPMLDPTDGNVVIFFATTDAVTNKQYWAKINAVTGAIMWKTAVPYTTPFTAQAMGNLVLPIGTVTYAVQSGGTPTLYTLNMATGVITSSVFNAVINPITNYIWWDTNRELIANVNTAFSTSPTFVGVYMQTHANFGGVAGLSIVPSVFNASAPPVTFVPLVIGNTYTSQGQIMPPDFQRDAGAINGPAFGKIRRLHWFGANVDKSMAFSVGVNFTDMLNVPMVDYQENTIAAPATFTGTISDTIQADYDFDSAISWQVVRPTPLTITAISGYIESVDK